MWTLAAKMLLHERVKFVVAIAGVSVSVMLVLVQVGMYLGFMNTASSIVDASTADLWVTQRGNESFEFAAPFDERPLYRIKSIPGVERAERVLMNFTQLKLSDGSQTGAEVVGIETTSDQPPLLAPWNVVEGDVQRLIEPGAIVIDRTDAGKHGLDRVGQDTEVFGVRAEVVGFTSGVRSFTTWPIVFADIRTARSFLPMFGPDAVTYILVKTQPSVNLEDIKGRINALPHVVAFTRAEMSDRTRTYWSKRTGVGVGFFTTAILGLLVGFVVIGQILYSGTIQYLREYGTLKAMGAKNSMVVRLIMSQAIISAVLGFVVGSVMAVVARVALDRAAQLSVSLSPALFAVTGVVTIAMCAAAALLSITKVLRLDPVSILKG